MHQHDIDTSWMKIRRIPYIYQSANLMAFACLHLAFYGCRHKKSTSKTHSHGHRQDLRLNPLTTLQTPRNNQVFNETEPFWLHHIMPLESVGWIYMRESGI
jgi:hypothetical protein